MITVIASIRVKAGERDAFIEMFKANLPAVLAEEGCLEYFPTVDIKSTLPPQEMDENVVTICETWETLEHLDAHSKAPHMLAYREQVKDIVEGMTIKVLTPA